MRDTAMQFNNVKKNNFKISSHKNIQLTNHSIIRAQERLNVTRKEDIKKLAGRAKSNGVNLSSLRPETYEKLGLTKEEYIFLKNRFVQGNNSTAIYIHQGYVYVFVGKGQRTLKTIISLKN